MLDTLSPYVRGVSAVAPLAAAVAIRLIFGKRRSASVLITAACVWLVVNVLMAPYSSHMRRDIETVVAWFR
jgi:hypothetical protein